MFQRIVTFVILLPLVFILIYLNVYAYRSPGAIVNYVSDFSNTLTTEQENVLNEKLKTFDAETSNEIAVVLIRSLEGDTIENYAVKLFEEYKLGKEKNDNGVLLLVAIEDRKLRIEVGYGLEGALTDLQSSQIISNDITPFFKKNDYYLGISKGIDSIILATKGEYEGSNVTNSEDDFPGVVIFFIYILLALFGPFSVAMAKSRYSYWLGGGCGLVVGIIFSVLMVIFIKSWFYIIMILPFVVLGFIIDFILSKLGVRSLNNFGRGFIGSGGTGFGGGGFHGGGGRSGGGGSSGSW